jgi:dihydroneopterin aldolase/2-amino-4-hydroxy-6-hydroxymethyldihydropteridine diphosphokinase
MDQLIIKDLELFAFHGVAESEKDLGQKFILDLTLDVDMEDAGHSDDIHDAIHYGILCKELQEEFCKHAYDLIEKAANMLAEFILFNYPTVEKVDLVLKKPWAPVHLPLRYPAVRIVRAWHSAIVAVGSNMGDRTATIDAAYELLNAHPHTQLVKKSTLIETDPVGYEDQDPFINGVMELRTIQSPKRLMTMLLDIEKELKRERIIRWGPRTIDLDLIYYDDMICDDEYTIIPHPRMHQRGFVLEPLAEIAPFRRHPVYGLRTLDLLKQFQEQS